MYSKIITVLLDFRNSYSSSIGTPPNRIGKKIIEDIEDDLDEFSRSYPSARSRTGHGRMSAKYPDIGCKTCRFTFGDLASFYCQCDKTI